jgi:hypothetical protein
VVSLVQASSKQFVAQWTTLAISPDNSGLLANFGQPSSKGLIYNLFADKWLQLNAVGNEVYSAQAAYLASCKASFAFLMISGEFTQLVAANQFGVPLTSFDQTLSRTGTSIAPLSTHSVT